MRFNVITLKEPAKAELNAFEQGVGTAGGACCTRKAFAILQVGRSKL